MEDYKADSLKNNEEKKMTPVVGESAKIRERSKVQKFADVFISEDINDVKSFIFSDVLIPGLKNMLYSICANGLSMVLFGEAREKKSDHQVGASKVSYQGYYDKQKNSAERNYGSNSTSSGFDYNNLLFANRIDAEEVLDGMNDCISQYGIVSIGDMYDLANVSTDNFELNKYGWKSIQGCKVVPVKDGYILRLPRAVPISSIN